MCFAVELSALGRITNMKRLNGQTERTCLFALPMGVFASKIREGPTAIALYPCFACLCYSVQGGKASIVIAVQDGLPLIAYYLIV